MKPSRIITALLVLVVLIMWTGTALSQDEKKESAETAVTVAGILDNADCPLTETQIKSLKELDLSAGREAFRSLYEIFEEKQYEAFKEALGTRPGRDDRPDRPRYLMQVIIFEKEKCPLTQKQLTELLALPNERGSFQQAREIYTETQNEALGKIFRNRNRNR